MKPETLAKTKILLEQVLARGVSYRAAGEAMNIGRSTVERNIKTLIREAARQTSIPGLDEDALSYLPRLRQAHAAVLSAVHGYEPTPRGRPAPPPMNETQIAAATSQVRRRSENGHRDVALVYVLLCTGAKPIEIARLVVGDYLNRDGSVRASSVLRPDAAANGQSRPLYFRSARACAALDAYLNERVQRHLGTGRDGTFRGLDPDSALFLTQEGRPFEVKPRHVRDPRPTCRLMLATLQLAFRRAGWHGMTAQSARRAIAHELIERGADEAQVGEFLGIKSMRAVRRLLNTERRPLDVLAQDLV
jgi:integrase